MLVVNLLQRERRRGHDAGAIGRESTRCGTTADAVRTSIGLERGEVARRLPLSRSERGDVGVETSQTALLKRGVDVLTVVNGLHEMPHLRLKVFRRLQSVRELFHAVALFALRIPQTHHLLEQEQTVSLELLHLVLYSTVRPEL